MTIVTTPLIPSTVTYTATSAGVQLPVANFVRPGLYGTPNP